MSQTTLIANNLIDFIHKSPTMFHTISVIKEKLERHGFIHLCPEEKWHLKKDGKYYVTSNDSALIAFVINTDTPETEGFRMIGAHTDAPGFRLKPAPEIQKENYLLLNTEVYGGPILNTWFDRPLSMAGRISYSGSHILHPKHALIDFREPVAIIPNLAIHMNRDVNTGVNLNKQKDTLPVIKIIEDQLDDNYIKKVVSEQSGISFDQLLDVDLFLYPTEKGALVGVNKEFISAPRLDDLAMVYAGLEALLRAKHNSGINMMICFDNEEIGSRTKQGADSPFLSTTLERVMLSLNKDKEALYRALARSFLISADMAHAYHPNYPEKQDPTNTVLPGKGPAIKVNANQNYTTDSDSYGVFANICKKANVPYQVFVNRSDERGGSTIGPVSSSHVAVRSLDIGAPMLSMHSCRELMASQDITYTLNAFQTYYEL